MKLWLLTPNAGRPEWTESWQEPWKDPEYDMAFGFVVRAEFAAEARRVAAQQCGDEGESAWLNAEASSCEELLGAGEPCVVLRNMATNA